MPHITMKTSPRALHMLRVIAAETTETQARIMERLLQREARRLGLSVPPKKAGR